MAPYTYLSPLVDGVVDLGLDPRLPGGVDDGDDLGAELGRGERELDLRRHDLHRDLAVLLQTLPDLVAVLPQGLWIIEKKL